jgi:argininosuccinate lyase
LPLTYNKDLQEDKEQLFDAVDTLELCLAVATEMLAGITFDRDRLARAAADELLAATDVADLLVKHGVPFRRAHGIVAGVVRAAVENGKALSELSEDELRDLGMPAGEDSASPYADFYALLEEGAWLESKVSEGATSLPRVREQLAQARHIAESTATRA